MPVPVPRYTKQPSHCVIKSNQLIGSDYEPSIFQYLSQPPLPPTGPPPSFASREEWISSLPSWRRNKPRRIWEEDPTHLQGFAPQGFDRGLTAAVNAPVIKGPHTQACIPPLATLVASAGLDPSPLADMYPPHQDQDMDVCSPPVRGWQCQDGSQYHPVSFPRYGDMSPGSDTDSLMDVVHSGAYAGSRGDPYRAYSSQEVYGGQEYQRGAFSPVFEDLSPGPLDSGDPDSSPIGPATPFADFVDRAVAATRITGYDAIPPVHESQHSYQGDYCRGPCYQCQAYQPAVDQVPAPASEAVVTPSATAAYKKLAEPLAEWVASHVWKVCTTGMMLPDAYQPRAYMRHYSTVPPSQLASSTHSMLLSTLLQPSAVFLALWYIVRLPVFFGPAGLAAQDVKEHRFVTELLGDAHMQLDREAIESYAPFRLIILGCMLANKWLDDHTFSNKTWHTISNVPIQSLNRLESLALDIFDHDLSIQPGEWSDWLSDLLSYHLSLSSTACPQPISRPSTNPHTIIRKAIETLVQVQIVRVCHSCDDASCASSVPEPIFVGLEGKRGEKMDAEMYDVDALEIDLDEDGPLREEYLPRRRVSEAGSLRHTQLQDKHVETDRILPPPAKWSPSGDEPIIRDAARAQGQYVAVQPVAQMSLSSAPAPPLPFHQVLDPHRQPWPLASYIPKQEHGATYGAMAFPSQYSAYEYGYPASHVHQRSQSLSYNASVNGHDQGRPRSYSQSRYNRGYADVHYTDYPYVPAAVPTTSWNTYNVCRYGAYYDRPFEYQQRFPLPA